MSPGAVPGADNEAFWRGFLTHGHSREAIGRRVLKRIPRGPRCRLCAAPFFGPGAPLIRLLGKRPSDANPTMCSSCFAFLTENRGGAEIEGSMLFADIRGSTALAETMSTADFHSLLNRFYAAASSVIFEHDGTIDKFVGDEIVALFVPLLSGEHHISHAVQAAEALLRATGHADESGPWIPVGVGVHTGRAWFGTVGEARHIELTAVGDAMNTAARLASHAGPGEVVVSAEAAVAARLDPTLKRTALSLKGKALPTEVVILRVAP